MNWVIGSVLGVFVGELMETERHKWMTAELNLLLIPTPGGNKTGCVGCTDENA